MLREELDEPYFELIESHLKALKFNRRHADERTADDRQQGDGVHASPAAGAGPARAGVRPLRLQLHDPRPRREWLQGAERAGGAGREPRGQRRARRRSTTSTASSSMLRVELGVLRRLPEPGASDSPSWANPPRFPVPVAPRRAGAVGARAVRRVPAPDDLASAVVGNDLDADGKSLVMITGANQGGKSTFLRSVGLAQLMTQGGMFVGRRLTAGERLRRACSPTTSARRTRRWRAASSTRSLPA